MRVGGRIGDTLRLPSRRVRAAVTILVVLSMAAATGGVVALGAPSLLAGLVGTTAPALPVPTPVLGPLRADSPAPTAGGLAAALDPIAATMPGRLTGIVLDPANGAVLWERTPEVPMVPASTGKLLTAAAVLLTLAPTDTLTTRVVQGPEPGTVVLVGGGDPTLTALPDGEDGAYPDPPRLADLAAAVDEQVSVPITRVLVDTSRWQGPTLAEGWDPADVPGGFVAPIVPLMIDGGRVDPTEPNGRRVANPAAVAGRAFAALLDVPPDTVEPGSAGPGAQTLARISSAPVTELVELFLRTSDNVLAEALAREVALARKGEPSFTGAAEQTLAALSQAGFDAGGAVLADGSGLSLADRVPARLLGELLGAAATPAVGERDVQFLRPILTGLSVAGGDGTLDDRFGRDTDAAPGRGVVRAKTGTLTDVSSLAGIVTDADGRLLVFVLMSNGAPIGKVRPLLDGLAAELSGCGCR